MNKKGYVVTYLPFKKYLILVLIGVALFLLYYFFIMKSAGLVSIRKSCPDGIIPDRFYVRNSMNSWNPSYSSSVYEDSTKYPAIWNDNSPATIDWNTRCKLGDEEGQNVNYLYCTNILYSNTPINSDETIGKKTELSVDLVLDSKDSIIMQEYSSSSITYSPKVIDYKCHSTS